MHGEKYITNNEELSHISLINYRRNFIKKKKKNCMGLYYGKLLGTLEVKRNGVLEILKNYSYIIYGTINSIVSMYAPKACMYL